MYFPESQFQLGSPLILVTAPELTASFTPTSKVSWKVGAFLLCMFLLLPTLLRGPPWNEGHRPKVHHETSVLEVPAQEQHEDCCCSSSTNAFISYSPYTVRGYRTSPVHGPFKSICRSGANPEKTLHIRGGAMQVYHHNQ